MSEAARTLIQKVLGTCAAVRPDGFVDYAANPCLGDDCFVPSDFSLRALEDALECSLCVQSAADAATAAGAREGALAAGPAASAISSKSPLHVFHLRMARRLSTDPGTVDQFLSALRETLREASEIERVTIIKSLEG